MASAFKDKFGWIADFRPPAVSGKKRRRVRVPAGQLTGGDAAAAARAFAQELERYSRLIDGDTPMDGAIEHAERIGAITQAEAQALREGLSRPAAEDPGRPTLLDAADAHPSSKREARGAPASYDQHMAYLKEFVAWSALAFVDQINLDVVLRYIAYMRDGRGLKYPTRRHRLLFLRRACRMGAGAYGLPDPLVGFVLDRNDSPPVVQVWTPEELCQAAAYLKAKGDGRALAALALGGFAGLRPSEMARARVKDLSGGVLAVGQVVRKNASSRRQLPLPAVAAQWVKEWIEGRDPSIPIISPDKRTKRPADAEYDHRGLSSWLADVLAEATGRALPIKCLRKSFATWAISLGAPPNLVDEYMGHKVFGVSDITHRHYLAAARLKELEVVAKKIDKSAKSILQSLSTNDAGH